MCSEGIHECCHWILIKRCDDLVGSCQPWCKVVSLQCLHIIHFLSVALSQFIISTGYAKGFHRSDSKVLISSVSDIMLAAVRQAAAAAASSPSCRFPRD